MSLIIRGWRCVSLAILWLAVCELAAASTVTLTATQDNRMVGCCGQADLHQADFLSAYNETGNQQNSVLQFDLSSIPAGAVIGSATLTLEGDSFYASNPSGVSMDIYRVVTPWNGSQVTWNSAATSTAWTTAGGDYVGTTGVQNVAPYASNDGTLPAMSRGPFSWNVTSLVAQWVSGAHPNDGLELLSATTGNGLTFDSTTTASGDGTTLIAPVLTITIVPEPSTFVLCGLGVVGLLVAARRRRKA